MLILVRHGRTPANRRGELQGRSDLELDELGLAQATRIADALVPILGEGTRVISSPLRRAQQTASLLGLPTVVDERWIEYDYGELEGTNVLEVPMAVWRQWQTDADFAPPGGESHGELQRRVFGALDELRAEIRERDVVVVSHVSPIKAAIAWVLGLPPTAGGRYHLDVASISRISSGREGVVLRSYNETWHL